MLAKVACDKQSQTIQHHVHLELRLPDLSTSTQTAGFSELFLLCLLCTNALDLFWNVSGLQLVSCPISRHCGYMRKWL